MPGPWEEYQQAAPAEDGPWAEYATDELAQAQQAPIRDLAPVTAEYGPLGSDGENYAAGIGKSFSDLYAGGKQFLTERFAEPLNAVGAIYDKLGLAPGNQSQGFTGAVNSNLAQQNAAIDETARLDAPLMGTKAGIGGYVTGSLAQILVPAVALRGTSAQRIFLPRTAQGNAAQGGAMGAIQPVTSDDSRLMQGGTGFAMAGAAAAVPRLGGAIVRGARGVLEPLTQGGQEAIAARVIRSSATNPAAISRAAPSPIPGVTRTLAEETNDPGIAQLQQQFPVQLSGQATANNAARVGYLRNSFGGATRDRAQAIREATETAQSKVRAQAIRQTGAESLKVVSWLDRVGKSPQFINDPDVSKSLGTVRNMLVNPVDDAGRLSAARSVVTDSLATPRRMSAADFDKVSEARRLVISGQRSGASPDEIAAELAKLKPQSVAATGTISDMRRALRTTERGKSDVASLYNARKHITQNLMPRASGAQMTVLRGTIKRLDEQIVAVAPSYKQYLADYAQGMREADRVQVGADLIRKTTSEGVSERNIQPANFNRRTDELDTLVRGSTGFGRARADKLLTPQQMQAIGNVREDLTRLQFADKPAAKGSPTVQNLATQNAIGQIAGTSRLGKLMMDSQVAQRITTPIEKTYGLFGVPDRLQQVLVDALANPAQARLILSRLPTSDRRVIENALVRVGGGAGVVTTATAE